MMGFENVSPDVAKDLIELVNSIKGLEKSSKVEYSVKNKDGGWSKKTFNYVPLDNILEKVKENNNFALLQPIGIDENGINGVKCILIHKSGHIFETNTYPFNAVESTKIQDEGAEITYRKRYSVSAFLGMATEEDIDGNDPTSNASTEKKYKEVKEKKATEGQVAVLNKLSDEDKAKVYAKCGVENIEDLTMKQASEIIGKLKGNK